MRARLAAAIAALLLSIAVARAAGADWGQVDEALGVKGADQPGETRKYGLPRSDLRVALDGVAIKPAFALGGWLAFKATDGGAMVMGDLVLTESELNPVLTKLLAGGITVTAVHNHLLRAQPATLYVHVFAHGDPAKIAGAVREALGASATPFGSTPSAPPGALDLDTKALDAAIGSKGKENGGVWQYAIPRAEPIQDAGMAIPPAMGTAIAINFQPTGDGKAAITGDFVLLADEVNPVLHALRDHGIEVTAVHNHMLDEQPRAFFVHFWAHGDANKLAEGLRAALGKARLEKAG